MGRNLIYHISNQQSSKIIIAGNNSSVDELSSIWHNFVLAKSVFNWQKMPLTFWKGNC